MAVTKADVVEYLKGMTLLEASELVKELEEVFGVSAAAAAAPMAMAAAAGGDAARSRTRLWPVGGKHISGGVDPGATFLFTTGARLGPVSFADQEPLHVRIGDASC